MLKGFADQFHDYNEAYILEFFGFSEEEIGNYMSAIEKLNAKGIVLK